MGQTMTCYGCELPVDEDATGTVWLQTPLGLTAVKTHREQACARLAAGRYPEQPAKRVPRPLTKEEKERR